jgi:hypothetical protein
VPKSGRPTSGAVHPSFETAAQKGRPPQDEVRILSQALRSAASLRRVLRLSKDEGWQQTHAVHPSFGLRIHGQKWKFTPFRPMFSINEWLCEM